MDADDCRGGGGCMAPARVEAEAAAKQVADYLGTVHHAYTFTVEQGVDAVSQVIQHLETFDVTTIRAATCVTVYLPAN